MHLRSPSGLHYSGHLPNAPYADASGAIIHTWRPGHWYTWFFEVGEDKHDKVDHWTFFDG